MSIASRIEEIETHIGDVYDTINYSYDTTGINKNIINIPKYLKKGYIDIINNGIDTLYNNFPKVSGIGSNLSLTPTYEAPMKLNEIQGNTLQENTPTPSAPVEIQSVTGLQKIGITGKNLFNFNTFISSSNYAVIDSSSSNSLVARVTQASTWATVRYRIFNLKENTNYSLKYDFENSYNSELYKHTWVVVKNPITGDNIYNEAYYKNDVVTFNTGDNKYLDLLFHVTINAPAVINTLTITNIQLEEGNSVGEYEPYKGNTYEVNLGKNLLNISNGTYTLNGINVNVENGKITINGTSTANTNIQISNLKITEPGTYTISATPDISSYGNSLQLGGYVYKANGTYKTNIDVRNVNKTQTITNGEYITNFWVYVPNGNTINNVELSLQLEKGSKATSYSPYFTPIELNKIGDYQDSIKKSTGKNLFDKDNANTLNSIINGNNGTLSAFDTCRTIYIPCKPNTTYVVSRISGTRFVVGTTTNQPTIGMVCNSFIGNNTASSIRITTGANDNYLCVFYYNSGSDTLTEQAIRDTLMIQEGSIVSPYEPYGKVWYVEKQIGKLQLTNTDNINNFSEATNTDYIYIYTKYYDNLVANSFDGLSSCFKNYGDTFAIGNNINETVYSFGGNQWAKLRFMVEKSLLSDTSTSSAMRTSFNTLLQEKQPVFYYPLATPTYTEITNEELIEDLETLYTAKSQEGTTNISITSEDLEMILNVSALKSE